MTEKNRVLSEALGIAIQETQMQVKPRVFWGRETGGYKGKSYKVITVLLQDL